MYMYACNFLPGTSLGDSDVIILPPPISFSVIEGDSVSLPCVGSGGAAPNFTLDGAAVQSAAATSGLYSLDFASISASDSGIYTCQIGYTNASTVVDVTGEPCYALNYAVGCISIFMSSLH